MSDWTATAIIVAVIVVSETGVRIIHHREKKGK